MTKLWEIREQMEANEAVQLENIVNSNFKKDSYYIFKHSNWDGNFSNVMKSVYMLRSTKPPKMLGSVLWYVDNKEGSISRIWELPFDVDVPTEFLDPGAPQEHIAESVADIRSAIVLS